MKTVLQMLLAIVLLGIVGSRADLNPSLALRNVPPTTLAVTALSAANTTVTATLPLVTGQFHYITSIQIVRTCTAAITGSAVLAITSTNLPGSLAWTSGNACPIGSTNVDVSLTPMNPLKSLTIGTATTIVAPAAGATGIYRLNVLYFTAP